MGIKESGFCPLARFQFYELDGSVTTALMTLMVV